MYYYSIKLTEKILSLSFWPQKFLYTRSYSLIYVGHSVLQCFTSGPWINYRWAATSDLSECMEVLSEETPRTDSTEVTSVVLTDATCLCHGHIAADNF